VPTGYQAAILDLSLPWSLLDQVKLSQPWLFLKGKIIGTD